LRLRRATLYRGLPPRWLGNEHLEVAVTLNNLALVLAEQDKFDQAEPLLRESLEMNKKLFGNENPLGANTLTSLAKLLDREGKLQEADTVGREAVAMQKKLLGSEQHVQPVSAFATLR